MNDLNRLNQLRSLVALTAEGLLIEYPINLFYLTGLELSAGKLLINAEEASLFVDGRYFEVCRKKSPYPVYLLEEGSIKNWITSHSICTLAFESDKTTYQTFLHLQRLAEELQSQGHPLTLIPADSPVQTVRIIKDPQEISILQEAARLGYEGYAFLLSLLKEGVRESELACELEFFWRKKGAKKLAFDPIIAFGANGSMPHYRAGDTILATGMSVLIDIGVVWQHYCSDLTRTLFFGHPDPKIEEIYAVVKEAKEQALAICKPGTPIGALDAAARQFIASKGYGNYFTHSLGHGVGLEIHEPPTLRQQGPFKDTPLQPGMVITIEPGIYLPQIGGVRLEDTILITPSGYQNLTAFD